MTWLTRRPRSQRTSEHERARTLAAERLDGSLDDDHSRWLDGHLAGCRSCARIAGEYAEQRTLLRSMPVPAPPRDLWARTASAIEGEDRSRRSGSIRGPRVARLPAVPLGILSGALVVAVVVTASLLATPGIQPIQPTPSQPAIAATSPTPLASPIAPAATPISVATNVNWVEAGDDGTFTWFRGNVDKVCPPQAEPDCAPIEEGLGQRLTLAETPHSVIQSPSDNEIVITSGGSVIVVPVQGPSPSAEPSPSVVPSSSPSETPTESPSETPTATPAPPSVSPSPDPSQQPSSDPSPGVTIEPSSSPSTSPSPPLSPSPSPAAALAILSNVIVVGETAAYSGDGQWFAFTARPADNTQGPDIYIWNASLPQAIPVTSDHRSVFSSWLGDRMIGSTAVAAGPDLAASSFLLDPATGETLESPVADLWRPVVDPQERWAFGWEGSLTTDGVTVGALDGRLVLVDWSPRGAASGGSPRDDPVVVAEGRIGEWDARWDETGRLLAVWIADPSDPAIGRLSLYEVNPGNGRIDQKEPLLRDWLALAGFAIGQGRLAWAAPPGENGAGSQLQVLAWTDDGAGQVVTDPGSGELIVAR